MNSPKLLPPVPEGQRRRWFVCPAHNSQAYIDNGKSEQVPNEGTLGCGCDINARHIVESDEAVTADGSRGYDYYGQLDAGHVPTDQHRDLSDYYRDRLIPDTKSI